MAIFIYLFNEITENECVNEKHPFVKGDNLTNNTARWLENSASKDVS